MSETKQFDVPEVLAALEAAVAKRGEDYVYERQGGACLYVHDRESDNPTPGCVVGQVYYDLTGEMVPEDDEFEGVQYTDTVSATYTPAALTVLAEAQGHQDCGGTWGEALAAAKQKAAEV